MMDLATALVTSVEKAGGKNKDVMRIFSDERLATQIGLLFAGAGHFQYPCEINCPELLKGADDDPEKSVYEAVIEDVPKSNNLDVANLEIVPYHKQKEIGVKGPEVRKRAIHLKANWGLSDVPTLFGEDGKGTRMLADFRDKWIIIPGTVILSSSKLGGPLCQLIPLIHWDKKEEIWKIAWSYLSMSYDRVYCLIRVKKTAL